MNKIPYSTPAACWICLQTSPEVLETSASLHKQFVNFCHNHLKVRVPPELSQLSKPSTLVFCGECRALIERTLELYSQFIRLQFKLHGFVRRLGELMLHSEGPPQNLNGRAKEPESLRKLRVKCFRKELSRKCWKTSQMMLPKLAIKRLNLPDPDKPTRDVMLSFIILYCIGYGKDFVALSKVPTRPYITRSFPVQKIMGIYSYSKLAAETSGERKSKVITPGFDRERSPSAMSVGDYSNDCDYNSPPPASDFESGSVEDIDSCNIDLVKNPLSDNDASANDSDFEPWSEDEDPPPKKLKTSPTADAKSRPSSTNPKLSSTPLHENQDEECVKCETCQAVMDNVPSLAGHLKACHEVVDSKTFFCHFCPASYTTQQLFNIHKKWCHGHLATNIPCDVDNCSETFSSCKDLNEHLKSHKTADGKQGQVFVCERCGLGLSTDHRLKLHRLDHVKESPQDPIQCPEPGCGHSYTKRTILINHFNQAHGGDGRVPMVKCNNCPNYFLTNELLDNHSKFCGNPAIHLCNMCNLPFDSFVLLQRHLKSPGHRLKFEAKQKNFKFSCYRCEMRFPTEVTYQNHMIRFQDSCTKRVRSRPSSQNHKKKFKCGWCVRSFVLLRDAKSHVKKCHRKEYKLHFQASDGDNTKEPYKFKIIVVKKIVKTDQRQTEIPIKEETDDVPSVASSQSRSPELSIPTPKRVDSPPPSQSPQQSPLSEPLQSSSTSISLEDTRRTLRSRAGRKPVIDDPQSDEDVQDINVNVDSDFEAGLSEQLSGSDIEENDEAPKEKMRRATRPTKTVSKAPTAPPNIPESESGPYQCPDCPYRFKTGSFLYSHTVFAHNGGVDKLNFDCPICHKPQRDLEPLKTHFKHYHGENRSITNRTEQISCPFCWCSFVTKERMELHIKCSHWEITSIPCDDDKCSDTFRSVSDLRDHLKSSHGSQAIFWCDTCDLGFISATRLKLHRFDHAKVICSMPGMYRYRCDEPGCFDLFIKKSMLMHHYNFHHLPFEERETILRCASCKSCFVSPKRMEMHLSMCEVKYGRRVVVTSLKTRDTKEWSKPKHCRPCVQAFESFALLRAHQNTPEHRKVTKGFRKHYLSTVCDICGKSFATGRNLVRHLTTHSEPNLECEHCGKVFTTSLYLEDHITRTHKRVNKFICDVCGKGFRFRHELSLHKNDHDLPYHCHECPKRFSRKFAMEMHVRVAHTGDRYKCEWCSKTYSQPGNVKAHIKTNHPEQFAIHFPQNRKTTYRFLKFLVKADDLRLAEAEESRNDKAGFEGAGVTKKPEKVAGQSVRFPNAERGHIGESESLIDFREANAHGSYSRIESSGTTNDN